MKNLNRIIVFVVSLCLQFILVNIGISKEAEVCFVDIEGSNLKEAAEVKLACDLLGVKFNTYFVNTTYDKASSKSTKLLFNSEVLILTESVIKVVDKDIVSRIGDPDNKPKVLILGVTSNTNIETLKIWSGNRIKNFMQCDLRPRAIN